MKQYIIDAFTTVPGAGNPAAVCVMDAWPPAEKMQALAKKNNLSETAFLVKEEPGWRLRWFTPENEEVLCGHATLASSFVILNYVEPDSDSVLFHSRSGDLTVTRRGRLYEMDFPTYELTEIPVTEEMTQAFGIRPQKAVLGLDLTCVFETEEQVRAMVPDQALLETLPGRGQNVTAPGHDADCVSRSFFPKDAIPEDPVCGSAHCQIAAYARILKEELAVNAVRTSYYPQSRLTAYQASARGGTLYCELLPNGRILISGEAVPEKVEEIDWETD